MADKPPAKSKTTDGDDRNLIDVESSEGGLDFESWVIQFWQTNRKTILTSIMVALAVVVGFQLYRIVSAHRQTAIREAYAEATTDEALLSFAESNRGHPLSGAAYLTLADNAYALGDYNEAAGLYENAVGGLDIDALTYRAQLGQAVSFIQAELPSKGNPLLEELAANELVPIAIRSEAYFHLASLAVEAGDFERATENLDLIEELAPVGIWASRATSIRNTFPVQVE